MHTGQVWLEKRFGRGETKVTAGPPLRIKCLLLEWDTLTIKWRSWDRLTIKWRSTALLNRRGEVLLDNCYIV